ncbi:uncharacterized protein F5147DRAFT_780406 [Suillus discolor]|uniref:DUF6532 domain-containing protein n=1 Tax=Suillus discolor TaxID=1912936 RepID=A0A9P7EUY5_9AGAM|nr:uncharacterized protein F5147DRAFT_780406 [Suillus discolor]KAG2090097.1 hypothetical protein F5147DRAFT_780406 [Suillus discolor]
MDLHPRLRRKAKDQALDNPVWGPLRQNKRARKHERSPTDDIAPIPKRVKSVKSGGTKARAPEPPLRTGKSKSCKRPPPLASDSEDNVEVSQPQRLKKRARVSVEPSDIDSDTASKQSVSDRASSSEIEMSDSGSEPVESIAKALFEEVPAIVNTQADRQKKPAKSKSGRPRKTRYTLSQSPTPPPPVWGSQYRPWSAKEKKYTAEIPMWDSPMTRSSFGPQPLKHSSKSNTPSSAVQVKEDEEDLSILEIKPEPDVPPHADAMADLVYTKTGSVRLTDQNTELRKVIHHGILEVKAYIAFKHGYPEIVAKNSYAREILLQAAKHHKTAPIEKRMYVDDEYLSALANLIDARASLFRTEIKDVAYKYAPGYFRLGRDCNAIVDRLLAGHSYIFPQTFDAEGLPSPKRQKPYQGQPIVDTLYETFFKNTKSVGLQFAQHFLDIAENKTGRPEIPIPMLAMVSTAIHAVLVAKKNKAGEDFKFTGNQFCDIYTYHVALLERIRRTAPVKFHKMMADIYEEVQHLRRDTIGVYDKDTDLAFLDLEGMDDE